MSWVGRVLTKHSYKIGGGGGGAVPDLEPDYGGSVVDRAPVLHSRWEEVQ